MPAMRTTWMDVFAAVSDAGADDAETLAVVIDWVDSGRLRRPMRAGAPAGLGAEASAAAARPF